MIVKLDFKEEQLIEITWVYNNIDCETKTISAKLFRIAGFDELFAIHGDEWFGYEISELSTGMLVSQSEPTISKAKACARDKMKRNKKQWEQIKNKSIEQLTKLGYKYPLNTII